MNELPDLLQKWYVDGFRNLLLSNWDQHFYNEARRRIDEAETRGNQLFDSKNDGFVWLSLLLSFYHFPMRIGSYVLLSQNR